MAEKTGGSGAVVTLATTLITAVVAPIAIYKYTQNDKPAEKPAQVAEAPKPAPATPPALTTPPPTTVGVPVATPNPQKPPFAVALPNAPKPPYAVPGSTVGLVRPVPSLLPEGSTWEGTAGNQQLTLEVENSDKGSFSGLLIWGNKKQVVKVKGTINGDAVSFDWQEKDKLSLGSNIAPPMKYTATMKDREMQGEYRPPSSPVRAGLFTLKKK